MEPMLMCDSNDVHAPLGNPATCCQDLTRGTRHLKLCYISRALALAHIHEDTKMALLQGSFPSDWAEICRESGLYGWLFSLGLCLVISKINDTTPLHGLSAFLPHAEEHSDKLWCYHNWL